MGMGSNHAANLAEVILKTRRVWILSAFMTWIAFAVYSDMVWKNGYPYLASKWYLQGRGISPDTGTGRPGDRCVTFARGGHVFFMAEAEKFNRELTSFLENCGTKH